MQLPVHQHSNGGSYIIKICTEIIKKSSLACHES